MLLVNCPTPKRFQAVLILALFAVMAAICFCPVSRAAQAASAFYPQGSQFCFTFYSTKNNDSKNVLTAGATTTNDSAYVLTNGATGLGPYYGSQDAPLASAVGFNTRYIYKVTPPSMSNANSTVFDSSNWTWPSDQTITSQVAAIVTAVAANTNIALWDFEPEELRPWKPMELHYFSIVSAAIQANDPLKRPLYNYQPNNRNAATLSMIAPYEGIVTKGMYVNTITDDLGNACMTNRIWARWSMEQEMGAIAASNTAAVPWIHAWMEGDPPAGYAADIYPWCRHDSYLGLILGGKGIEIFSAFEGRAGFADTNFYAYLNGYLSVARDLNGPLDLAPVFLYGQKLTNGTMSITSGPSQMTLAYGGIVTNYPPIAWLETSYSNNAYVFMVNSAAVPVTAKFSGLPVQNRVDVFAGATNATSGGTFTLTLPAYGVDGFQFITTPGPLINQVTLTNGLLNLGGTGIAGWNYALQTSTNLIPPVSWVPVTTNLNPGATFLFTNLPASKSSNHFYRVVEL